MKNAIKYQNLYKAFDEAYPLMMAVDFRLKNLPAESKVKLLHALCTDDSDIVSQLYRNQVVQNSQLHIENLRTYNTVCLATYVQAVNNLTNIKIRLLENEMNSRLADYLHYRGLRNIISFQVPEHDGGVSYAFAN